MMCRCMVLLAIMIPPTLRPALAAESPPHAAVNGEQSTLPATVAHELSPDEGREDLSVFFTIGVIVDVLLVTGFAVWAVGQWRKPRK